MSAPRWKPPHSLTTKSWILSFLDVIYMELSTAWINGANKITLNTWHVTVTFWKLCCKISTLPLCLPPVSLGVMSPLSCLYMFFLLSHILPLHWVFMSFTVLVQPLFIFIFHCSLFISWHVFLCLGLIVGAQHRNVFIISVDVSLFDYIC